MRQIFQTTTINMTFIHGEHRESIWRITNPKRKGWLLRHECSGNAISRKREEKKTSLAAKSQADDRAIRRDLTTKRRRFGDHYFRFDLPPLSSPRSLVSPSLIPLICIDDNFTRPSRRQTPPQHSRQKVLAPLANAKSRRRRERANRRNGSAVLRFVGRKKRTYVTHYPCRGQYSKLWLSSTSSGRRALVPQGR